MNSLWHVRAMVNVRCCPVTFRRAQYVLSITAFFVKHIAITARCLSIGIAIESARRPLPFLTAALLSA